jgi:hypothetical protein
MLSRLLNPKIESALNQFPAVGLIGSRQSGKTTLAHQLAQVRGEAVVYLDLELPSDLAKLAEPELYLANHVDRLVILDEIQRHPDLFPVLRSLIDQQRRPGRFLILGSASPALLQQSSETLAGRIRFLELPPFLLNEVVKNQEDPSTTQRQLWLQGGYPDSFLADSQQASRQWRAAFIATFLERDVPQLGFRVSAAQMRRFWEMLAHVQSQVWNASAFARNFAVSAPTVRHHLDLLTDALLVRQLQPLHANLKKRLVKSPKVYLRDTGLLHELLRIADWESLQGHPVLGASFEGFAIEQIIQAAPEHADAAFYRTHTGDEIDLVLTLDGGRRIAVEVKYTAAPKLSAGFRRALADIGAEKGYIVTAGTAEFPLAAGVRAVPLGDFIGREMETLVEP